MRQAVEVIAKEDWKIAKTSADIKAFARRCSEISNAFKDLVGQLAKVEVNAKRRCGAPEDGLDIIRESKRKAESIYMLFFGAAEKMHRPDKLKLFYNAVKEDALLEIPLAVVSVVAKET